MGKDLAANFGVAKRVFEEVDDALCQRLSCIMFDGTEAELTLTENAQPAIMASSIALLKVMEAEKGFDASAYAAYFAGHSLGEYTALAAARSLSLADTARLLKIRGQAMQKAVPVGEGAMAAILGLDFGQVAEIVAEAAKIGVVAVANDNSPGQVVVSGAAAAVRRASELAKEKGAKRAVLLPVSAPFHSPLMQPAAIVMKEALASVAIHGPALPVIANVTAEAVSNPDAIRALLVEQVTGMVRWRESVLKLAGLGVGSVLEIGVGKVLTGLVRRIDKNLEANCVASVEDIDAFAVTV
jgi:[acyl-carrier-protein] S-malonyltransferase